MNFGFPPVELLLCQGNVGIAALGVVKGKGLIYNSELGLGELGNEVGKFVNGEFLWVAKIDRAYERIVGRHHSHESFDEVVDILETTGLLSVAIDCDTFFLESFHDEIGDDTPVVGKHIGTVGVENAHDFHWNLVLAMKVHGERFGAALALIVTGSAPDWIHVSPIRFALRVLKRVAIYFAC